MLWLSGRRRNSGHRDFITSEHVRYQKTGRDLGTVNDIDDGRRVDVTAFPVVSSEGEISGELVVG